jgi:hypothetical protein
MKKKNFVFISISFFLLYHSVQQELHLSPIEVIYGGIKVKLFCVILGSFYFIVIPFYSVINKHLKLSFLN